MAKTEIILTHNVVGLGGESDQIKVAAGYARNYLIPQGLAVPVTAANKRRLEVLKQRRAEREAHELQTMTEMAKGLSKLTVVITVKTGEDGKMFGSVTAGHIADELKRQYEAVLDKKKIHIDSPLRTLGDHEVELRLHPDVTTTLKVRVESSTPVATPASEASTPSKESAKGKEARAEKSPKGEVKAERKAKPARAPKE